MAVRIQWRIRTLVKFGVRYSTNLAHFICQIVFKVGNTMAGAGRRRELPNFAGISAEVQVTFWNAVFTFTTVWICCNNGHHRVIISTHNCVGIKVGRRTGDKNHPPPPMWLLKLLLSKHSDMSGAFSTLLVVQSLRCYHVSIASYMSPWWTNTRSGCHAMHLLQTKRLLLKCWRMWEQTDSYASLASLCHSQRSNLDSVMSPQQSESHIDWSVDESLINIDWVCWTDKIGIVLPSGTVKKNISGVTLRCNVNKTKKKVHWQTDRHITLLYCHICICVHQWLVLHFFLSCHLFNLIQIRVPSNGRAQFLHFLIKPIVQVFRFWTGPCIRPGVRRLGAVLREWTRQTAESFENVDTKTLSVVKEAINLSVTRSEIRSCLSASVCRHNQLD